MFRPSPPQSQGRGHRNPGIQQRVVKTAGRVTNALMAAAKGRLEADEPLRIDTIYDQERARLKVILIGGIATTASLLRFMTAYLKS